MRLFLDVVPKNTLVEVSVNGCNHTYYLLLYVVPKTPFVEVSGCIYVT